jgi:hypothetical protein
MLDSMKSFIVTFTGIVIGLLASLASIPWLTILSTIIALIGSYVQYKDALPYEFVFNSGLWQGRERDFNLVIPKNQHKKVNPTTTVYMLQNQSYQLIMCGIMADESEAIILDACAPFDGKVIIK